MNRELGRNSVVLALTLIGVIYVVAGASEDPMAMRLVAGCGAWLLAAVYWHVTKPRGRE